MSAIIQVTPEEIREAVRIFDLLDAEDVAAVTQAMSEATEVGARTGAAITESVKQKQGSQGVLASVAVTNFLVGFLAGRNRTEEPYCTFVDTGKRRFPMHGWWYFYVKAKGICPLYCEMDFKPAYEAADYGILRMVMGTR